MKKNKLIFLAILFFLFIRTAQASYVEQNSLEQSITQKIQITLDRLFGANNFIVRTSVELGQDSWRMVYTDASNIERAKKESSNSGEKILILPGYPVIKNLSSDDFSRNPFNSKLYNIPAPIKNIRVNLTVNSDFPRENLGKVKALAIKVGELNLGRGDRLDLEYDAFAVVDQVDNAKNSVGKLNTVYPAADNKILINQLARLTNTLMSLLFLFAFFILLYLVFGLLKSRQAGKNSPFFKGKDFEFKPQLNVTPNIGVNVKNEAGKSGAAVLTPLSIKQYFDFVTDQNIDKLLAFFESEKLHVDQISIILSYLQPKHAAYILSKMGVEAQAVISADLINPKLLDRKVIDALELKVKNFLECTIGGARRFQDIFNVIPSQAKKKILQVLAKKHPERYKVYRENILIFDDIRLLSPDHLCVLISELSIEFLSISLLGAEKETFEVINSQLTDSARAMVAQFISLKKAAISASEIETAQEYVLDIFSRLKDEKKINIVFS